MSDEYWGVKLPKTRIGTKVPTIEAQRKFFKSLAKKENIRVRWDKTCTVPNAEIDASGNATITLRVPGAHDIDVWQGEAHHEISHLFEEVKFTLDAHSMFKRQVEQDVGNILSDYLCEKNKNGLYPGRDRIMWEMRDKLMTSIPDLWMSRRHPGIGALLDYDVKMRRDWQGMLPALKVPEYSDVYQARFDEIRLKTKIDQVLELQDVEEFYRLVQMTCECIMKPLEEEEKKREKGRGHEGKGGDSDGDGRSSTKSGDPEDSGDGAGAGVGDGEGSVKPYKTEPSGGGGDKPSKPHSPHREDEISGGTASKKSEKREDDDYGESDLPKELKTLEPLKSVRSEEYKPFTKHDHILPNYNVDERCHDQITHRLGKSTVSKRIKRYLKIVSKDGYNYGQKKGKLHVKNMHRIYGASEEPRIFKQKDRALLKTDTAVSLLLDCSGSMRGSRYWTGAACCVAIHQTLLDLRIVHEILGFSEYHKLWTYYFKTFEQNMSSEKLIRGFSSSNINLRENADGESVLYAAERLQERKEGHKLLIVLSDGHPAGTYTGNGYWYLKVVTNAVEASGIDLMGIGIQTTSVREFYNHNYVVNKITDLDTVLFEHLKKALT
jgi:hypothetical protein